MNDCENILVCRKSGKGAAEWYGKDRRRREINANNRVKKRGKSGKIQIRKRIKDKTKIKEVEENWASVEMERVAERKVATGQGRWLGYSSWRQT